MKRKSEKIRVAFIFTHLALNGHGKSLKLFAGQWRRRCTGGQRAAPAVARPPSVAGAGAHGVVGVAGIVGVVVPVAGDAGKRVEQRTRRPSAYPVGAPCALGGCWAPTAGVVVVVVIGVAVTVTAAHPSCSRTAGCRPVVEAGAEEVASCNSVPCCCCGSHADAAVAGGQRTAMWRPDALLGKLVARTVVFVVVVAAVTVAANVVVVWPSSQGWRYGTRNRVGCCVEEGRGVAGVVVVVVGTDGRCCKCL